MESPGWKLDEGSFLEAVFGETTFTVTVMCACFMLICNYLNYAAFDKLKLKSKPLNTYFHLIWS